MEKGISAASATASAVVAASAAVVVIAAAVVSAAGEEKDKDDDPPAAIVVSEHEISPRKKKFISASVFRFAGMLYDMKTISRWLRKNRGMIGGFYEQQRI